MSVSNADGPAESSGVAPQSPGAAEAQIIPKVRVDPTRAAHTPPDLPSDPARGRVWVVQHNEALLDVIRALVHRDETEMKKFEDGESKVAGDDLFKQIAYRTLVADFLALDR